MTSQIKPEEIFNVFNNIKDKNKIAARYSLHRKTDERLIDDILRASRNETTVLNVITKLTRKIKRSRVKARKYQVKFRIKREQINQLKFLDSMPNRTIRKLKKTLSKHWATEGLFQASEAKRDNLRQELQFSEKQNELLRWDRERMLKKLAGMEKKYQEQNEILEATKEQLHSVSKALSHEAQSRESCSQATHRNETELLAKAEPEAKVGRVENNNGGSSVSDLGAKMGLLAVSGQDMKGFKRKLVEEDRELGVTKGHREKFHKGFWASLAAKGAFRF